jgi:hypothetical protein
MGTKVVDGTDHDYRRNKKKSGCRYMGTKVVHRTTHDNRRNKKSGREYSEQKLSPWK